jgi:hypothetical protein
MQHNCDIQNIAFLDVLIICSADLVKQTGTNIGNTFYNQLVSSLVEGLFISNIDKTWTVEADGKLTYNIISLHEFAFLCQNVFEIVDYTKEIW